MKRTTRKPSAVFKQVLQAAEDQLILSSRSATPYKHRGIRGAERARALQKIVDGHLPTVFSTSKGEVIDYRDNRTGEIDFCIFDSSTASPIHASGDNSLIPAEALYAVVEVKSTLTQNELDKCFVAAEKIRALQPFKESFLGAQESATSASKCRCMYVVFAFQSNLSNTGWAKKEFRRLETAAAKANGTLGLIDQVIVMNRGIIRPEACKAITQDSAKGLFLEFYVGLMNFLMRERRRRPEIDWAAYFWRSPWEKIA
jgi:hypothetical protein